MSKDKLENWALTKVRKEHVLNDYRNYYASDFVHALLSAHAYKTNVEGEQLEFPKNPGGNCKAKYNVHLGGWRVAKVFSPKDSDDYYSCLYINPDLGQAVLAHRGTKIVESFTGKNKSLSADIKEILNGNMGLQQYSSYMATGESLQILQNLNIKSGSRYADYNFSITGHSLGAWLAELSLYFCHKKFNYDKVRAVTFDSPGISKDIMQSFRSNISSERSFDVDSLDLVTYLSAPNLVNTCNTHAGTVYRVYPNITDLLKSDSLEESHQKIEKLLILESDNGIVSSMKNLVKKGCQTLSNQFKDQLEKYNNYAYTFLSITGHSLDVIIDVFDQETHMPNKYDKVSSWPLIKHKNTGKLRLGKPIIEAIKASLKSFCYDSNVYTDIQKSEEDFESGFLGDDTGSLMVDVFVDFSLGRIDLEEIFQTFKNLDLNKNHEGYPQMNSVGDKTDYDENYPEKANIDFGNIVYNFRYKTEPADPFIIEVSKTNPSKSIRCLVELDKLKNTKYHKEGFNSLIDSVPGNLKPILKEFCENFKVRYGGSGYDNKIFILGLNNYPASLLKDKMQFLLDFDKTLSEKILEEKIMSKSFGSVVMKQSGIIRKDDFPNNLPKKEQITVKREDLIKKIDDLFQDNNLVAISAPKDGGKTVLACEYGRKIQKASPLKLNVKWFSASDKELLMNDYQNFVEKVGIEDQELELKEKVELVNNRIVKDNKEMTFIFDNVKNYSDIAKYLPNLEIENSGIKVLVTTRNQKLLSKLLPKSSSVTLRSFNKNEAKEYAKQFLGERVNEEAIANIMKVISAETGQILPGKLCHDMKFLNNNRMLTVEECLEKYKDSQVEQYLNEFFDDVVGDNVNLPEKELAHEIMKYSIFLDAEFIGVDILKTLTKKEEKKLDESLKYLEEHSFGSVVHEKGEAGFKIDGIIYKMASQYQALHDKSKLSKIAEVLVSLMPKPGFNVRDDWKAGTIYKQIKVCLSHLESEELAPELEVDLLNQKIGYEISILSDYDSAMESQNNIIDILKLSKNELNLAKAYAKRAEIYQLQGSYKNAMNDISEAEEIIGKCSIQEVELQNIQSEILHRKSIIYLNQNDLENAEITAKESIELNRTMDALNVLGDIYFLKGEYDEALEIYQAVKNNFSDDITSFVKSYIGSAKVRMKLGELKQAEADCIKALNISEDSYGGKQHPVIAQAQYMLGDVYYAENKYKDALVSYKNSTEICHGLGRHGKEFVNSLKAMSCTLIKLKKYDKAESYQKIALDRMEKLGIGGVQKTELLKDMGFAYTQLGHVEKARDCYKDADKEVNKLINDNNTNDEHTEIKKESSNTSPEKILYNKQEVINLKIDVRYGLGNVNAILGKNDRACAYYESALSWCDSKISSRKAELLCSLGKSKSLLACTEEDYWQSLDCYVQALQMHKMLSESTFGQVKDIIGEIKSICKELGTDYQSLKKMPKFQEMMYSAIPKVSKAQDIVKYYPDMFEKLSSAYSASYPDKAKFYNEVGQQKSSFDPRTSHYILRPLSCAESVAKDDSFDLMNKLLLAKTLQKISEKSAIGSWTEKGFKTFNYEMGVKGYVGKTYLGQYVEEADIEVAKMLCFEAIALGIAANQSGQRNYECLEKFVQRNPKIIERMFTGNHTEYFLDGRILRYCAGIKLEYQKRLEMSIKDKPELLIKFVKEKDHDYEEAKTKYLDANNKKDDKVKKSLEEIEGRIKSPNAEKAINNAKKLLNKHEDLVENLYKTHEQELQIVPELVPYNQNCKDLIDKLNDSYLCNENDDNLNQIKTKTAAYYFREANKKFKDHNYKKALNYYKKALDPVSSENVNDKDKADIFYKIGQIYQELGEHDHALIYAVRSMAVRKILGYDGSYQDSKSSIKLVKSICESLKIKYKNYEESAKFMEYLYSVIPVFENSSEVIEIVEGLSRYYTKKYPHKSVTYDSIAKFLSDPKFSHNNIMIKPLFRDYKSSSKESDVKQNNNCNENNAVVEDMASFVEEFAVMEKLLGSLKSISDNAQQGNWSSGYLIGVATPLGDYGVKGYIDDKYLEKKLGNLNSEKNLNIAKALCFEAICLGISSSKTARNYTCLEEFAKEHPDIVQNIHKTHPEYFVDQNILNCCRSYMGQNLFEDFENQIHSEFFPDEFFSDDFCQDSLVEEVKLSGSEVA